MHFLSILTATASVVAIGNAMPSSAAERAGTSTSKHFRLKTKVTEGGRMDLNDNYVNLLPAGTAGKGGFKKNVPITAANTKDSAAIFHKVGSSQYFTTVKGVDYGIITFAPDNSIEAFKPVQINENSSESGFKVTDDGYFINFTNNNTYGAWVSCYWDTGNPQLFEVLGERKTAAFTPPNCAHVDLVAEYV